MSTGHYNACLTEEEMARASGREGINSGTLAVRAAVFHEVMREWGRLDAEEPRRNTGFHDQASWNRLVLNCPAREPEGGDAQAKKYAKSARTDMDKVIKNHPDTPWAILAKRDKYMALGLEWKSTK